MSTTLGTPTPRVGGASTTLRGRSRTRRAPERQAVWRHPTSPVRIRREALLHLSGLQPLTSDDTRPAGDRNRPTRLEVRHHASAVRLLETSIDDGTRWVGLRAERRARTTRSLWADGAGEQRAGPVVLPVSTKGRRHGTHRQNMDHTTNNTDHDALDAYSQVVSGVAEMLLPRVAAIRVRRRGRSGEAAGSAVALTGEGHLITNAHVVGNADTGEATFADGSVATLEIVGRDPLADLAVVRTDRRDRGAAGLPRRRRPEDRHPGGRRRQPARHGRQRQRRASSAGSGGRCRSTPATPPASSRTSSRPMPPSTPATPAVRSPTPAAG